MALTDYDKKNLSSSDQKKIQQATAKWEAANAKGDTAGMAAAAAEAAAVRNNAGYKTDSSGNYIGAYTPTSTTSSTKTTVSNLPKSNYSNQSTSTSASGGNSQYTTNTYTPTNTNNAYHYTIGSDKGKEIANNLPIGDTYQCSDGSVWTKNDDGSVSVRYNGQTYHNAYQMDDIGSIGLQQMDAGLDWRILQDTLDSRVNKALTTNGLEQYAYDDIYKQMSQYISNAKAAENQQNNQSSGGGAQSWVGSYVQSNPQPTYNSKYDPEIDRLLNEILNRDDFSYDAQNDPLYQQYAQMYQREGDRAMRETLAEAASGAGGMNTYAITAAQQAANRYASQLNDKIPELYQLAYDMYLADKDSKIQDLGLLQNADATQYNRYRDTMSDWRNDRSFAYGAYQDDVAQGNWQKTFDYNAAIDDRNFNYNSGWDSIKWNANQDQIALENSRYDTEQADAQVEYLISLGQMPSAELIAKSSWSQSDIDLAVAAVQAQGKGPIVGGNTGNDPKPNNPLLNPALDKSPFFANNPFHEDEDEGAITEGDGSVIGLGIGPARKDILEQLVKADGVVIDENGNYYWANGWNNVNYQQRLAQYK